MQNSAFLVQLVISMADNELLQNEFSKLLQESLVSNDGNTGMQLSRCHTLTKENLVDFASLYYNLEIISKSEKSLKFDILFYFSKKNNIILLFFNLFSELIKLSKCWSIEDTDVAKVIFLKNQSKRTAHSTSFTIFCQFTMGAVINKNVLFLFTLIQICFTWQMYFN